VEKETKDVISLKHLLILDVVEIESALDQEHVRIDDVLILVGQITLVCKQSVQQLIIGPLVLALLV
jgi:hypothetical protein